MAVKVCMDSGRCLTCDYLSVEDVRKAKENNEPTVCCPKRDPEKDITPNPFDLWKWCVDTDKIETVESIPDKPDRDDDNPNPNNVQDLIALVKSISQLVRN